MQSVITDTGSWVQGAYSLAMALVAGASLAVGVWVVARERGRRISLSLLAGSVAVAVYLLAFSFLVRSTDRAAAERWAYVAYLGVPFIVPALYQFSMDLLGLWRQRRPWILTGWVVGFVYMALAQTSGLLIAGVMEVPPWGYYTDLTLWNTPFVAWSILLLWLALRDFWLEYRHAEPVQRARIRWLAIPLLVASVGFVDYAPSLGLDVPPLGFAFLAVFPVAAALAFGLGYYSHLVADSYQAAVTGRWADLGFLAWPLVQSPESTGPDSVVARFATLASELAAGDVSAFLAFEFALVLLAVALWASHGFPGLGVLRRVRPRRFWSSE